MGLLLGKNRLTACGLLFAAMVENDRMRVAFPRSGHVCRLQREAVYGGFAKLSQSGRAPPGKGAGGLNSLPAGVAARQGGIFPSNAGRLRPRAPPFPSAGPRGPGRKRALIGPRKALADLRSQLYIRRSFGSDQGSGRRWGSAVPENKRLSGTE